MVDSDGTAGMRPKVVGLGGTLRAGSASLAALRQALGAAERAGARTELLDLRQLRLPMYEPERPLEDCGAEVRRLVEALRDADAVIVSTAAYHGTLAGVTKNALDYAQFLARDGRPYLDGRAVGLIAVAGGDQAGPKAIAALVDTAHALRATVAPQSVVVPKARRAFDAQTGEFAGDYAGRLDRLGEAVVGLALRLGADGDRALSGAA